MKSFRRGGFSLTELMVVTGVIAMVAAIAAVGVSRHRENAEDVRMQAELNSIYKGMETHRQVYGRYPASYAELQPFVSIPDFGNRYDINPNPSGG
jgi:prepilin-type N-terminal cleavage/methylation domain-containing protein